MTKKVQKIKQDISIGRNIRKLRNRAQLTQEQVVIQMQLMGCEISRLALSKIENEYQHVKVSELKALKTILNAKYEEFFED